MKKILMVLVFLTSISNSSDYEAFEDLDLNISSKDDSVLIKGKLKKNEVERRFKFGFQKNLVSKARTSTGSDIHVLPDEVVDEVFVVGSDAIVEGYVLGDVRVIGGNIILKSGARVDGNLVNIGGRIKGAENIKIGGSVKSFFSDSFFDHRIKIFSFLRTYAFSFLYFIWIFSFLIFTGFFAIYFFPENSKKIKNVVGRRFFISFLVGVIALISFLPVMLILILTIMGIFFIPIVFVVYFLFACWGAAMFITYIGEKLPLKCERSSYINFMLGFVIFFLISSIPFMGKLFLIVILLLGLGGVFLGRFGKVT